MALYKLTNTPDRPTTVKKDDGSGVTLIIPFNPENTDYQEYLKWVEAGNTPEAAD